MATFHRVCSASELLSRQQLEATLGERKIALFALDNRFVATDANCPHANGPLAEGEVDGCVLSCPWHGWTFDLTTGVSPDDPCMKLEIFEVRVEGDDVLVGV